MVPESTINEAIKKSENIGKLCWMCKGENPTICTAKQSPDWEEWWFHEKCYWKLQDVLY